MQTTGNTGAFVKKDVHPRLKGKGKSPLSESMKAELAKRKAPAKKPVAVAKKAPSLMDKAKATAKGVMAEVKAIVPRKNAEVTRLKREQVDRHVEGRKPKPRGK